MKAIGHRSTDAKAWPNAEQKNQMNAQTHLEFTGRRFFLARGLMTIASVVAAGMVMLPSQHVRAEQPRQMAQAQTHTKVLTVFDTRTKAPIVGARVTGIWRDGHGQRGVLPSAVTSANGIAVISYAAAPYWEIWVTMPGYQTFHVTRLASNTRNQDNLPVAMRR